MKTFPLVLPALAFSTMPSIADEPRNTSPAKISAVEAAKHVGQTLIVIGTVAQETIRERAVFLSLDKPFLNSPLTEVIFAQYTNQFGDVSKLRGKPVETKGKVKSYRDKPAIIIERTNQLKVKQHNP
jgi:DNA/RNA endonuclease YhcR with UshA esterase domain